MEIWCQRRDSNSQTPVSKTGRYSNSRTLALWCTGEDLNLRVPLRGTRVTAGPFQPDSRTCASLAEGRRIERPWLITMPWFSGPVAGHSAVPSVVAESAGVEPASLLREPLFSRQVPYRPAHSPTKCQRTLSPHHAQKRCVLGARLVGPVGFEPTKGLLLRQLRMPVPPRAWLISLKLDRGSVTQSGSTEES